MIEYMGVSLNKGYGNETPVSIISESSFWIKECCLFVLQGCFYVQNR